MRAVEQMSAGAAQAFFQHRAGHARVRPGQQPGRMELHHLHVAQRQAEAERHRKPVHALVAGRRVIAVHGRAAAGRQQHGLRGDELEFAGAHIDQQHAGQRAVGGRDQRHGAVLFEPPDRPRPHLLHQPVDDLDAGEIALVHGAVEGLAGEGLAVQRAVGIAVEEAADLVFQFLHPLDRLGDQRPGQFLVRQPFAAFDGVHEMALDRVAGIERDIVAALHHAGAAAFAEQALADDGDVEIGIGLQACSAANSPAPPAPRIRMSVLRCSTFMPPSEHPHEEHEGDDRRHRGRERRQLLLAAAPSKFSITSTRKPRADES